MTEWWCCIIDGHPVVQGDEIQRELVVAANLVKSHVGEIQEGFCSFKIICIIIVHSTYLTENFKRRVFLLWLFIQATDSLPWYCPSFHKLFSGAFLLFFARTKIWLSPRDADSPAALLGLFSCSLQDLRFVKLGWCNLFCCCLAQIPLSLHAPIPFPGSYMCGLLAAHGYAF